METRGERGASEENDSQNNERGMQRGQGPVAEYSSGDEDFCTRSGHVKRITADEFL